MRDFLERIAPVWRPHPGQMAFLLGDARIKVLACGRRWGKTDACAVSILFHVLQPGATRQLLLAPTRDQASLLFDRVLALWDALADLEGGLPIAKVRRTPHPRLQIGDHVVTARSAHVPRLLRGQGATHIVVDEAAYLPESVVTEVAMPMLATAHGEMTLISTPHGKNHFWRFFQMGQRGDAGVWSRQAPTEESPHVHPEFLEVQRQLVSERAYRVEYKAEFVDARGQVFKNDLVQRCLVTQVPEPAGPFFIGVDWARYEDFTAVCVLSGNRDDAWLVELDRFQEDSWAATVARVATIVERFPGCQVLCDQTGSGDQAVENLARALPKFRVDGLTFTQSSKNALIDGLTWLIDRSALHMAPDPELLRELEQFESVTSAHGTKLAARSGYHDDLVVALSLAAFRLPTIHSARISVSGRRGPDILPSPPRL